MKLKLKNYLTLFTCLIFTIVLHPVNVTAQVDPSEDKTISPFFYVECSDSSIEKLPLKSTNVDVLISGVIADVTIHQQYINAGSKPIESKYIFPMSTKAAVYHLKMIIGQRILTAVIKEKQQAQQEYQEAVEAGRTATLLEQERPNVLQMRVGNIMPGDTINIILKYTELITPVEGVYEFVYPTVVGPRYFSNKHSNPSDSTWVEIPYTHEGVAPKSTFDIKISIDGGMPISGLNCPSHNPIDIDYLSTSLVSCQLLEGDSLSGNKDFVLDYVLSGEKNKTGMLLYKGEEENFFLSMIQPPAEPTSEDITSREYIFILDISGSMSGFPIETSKSLTREIIQNLKLQDKFNILCFAGGSSFLFNESKPATSENIGKALSFIGSLQGGGGTELLPALQKALGYPDDDQYSRIFLIATDGYVDIEKEAFDLIRNNLNKANFFSFGIGTSVNRYLIEGMAHAGMAEPFIVLSSADAAEKAAQFKKYVSSPVLTNIEATFQNIYVYDIEPITIPDVFAERPILIFGKWREPLLGSLTLTGITGNNKNYSSTLDFNSFEPSQKNSALRYLWARNRIQKLSDYSSVSGGDANKASIIELGLKYNLLTQYTSFIAVDSIIRNEGGNLTKVVVPNPMPEGVSDNAIGNNFGGMATEFSYQKEEISGSKIETFPNPFVDQITLLIYLDEIDFNKEKTLEVFNSCGEKLKTLNISEYKHPVNRFLLEQNGISFLSKGIYFVQLRINGLIKGECKIVKL